MFEEYQSNYKEIKLGKLKTSNLEIKQLIQAWIVISFAFTVANVGLDSGFSAFIVMLIISLVLVGTGFLFHELAHKIVAQKYGFFAEFRSDPTMLIFALLLSFTGFVFAAPGAVMIAAYGIDSKTNGIISLAGPLTNFVIALLSFGVYYLFPLQLILNVVAINAFLGTFNLLPFGNFDGAKIFMWNRKIWFLMLAIGLLLIFI